MLGLFAAILAFVFLGLGIALRRWSAVLVPALLWALIIGASALQGRVGDSENPPESFLLFWVIFALVPTVALTALGVILGKLVERTRARRRAARP
jgi:hypothetical protein